MTEKEKISKAPAARVRRTPVGRRNVLTVSGQDPDYVYRFVNDRGDRVNAFLDAGYELVEAKDVRIGEARVDRASEEGTRAMASVGGGTKAYLMRIRKDWYEEDQKAKQAHVDQTEAAMRDKALDGNYGKLEITRS